MITLLAFIHSRRTRIVFDRTVVLFFYMKELTRRTVARFSYANKKKKIKNLFCKVDEKINSGSTHQ